MSENEMRSESGNAFSVLRGCSGRCGNKIEYTVIDDMDDCAPDVAPRAAPVAYAGGHLCQACAAVVRDALKGRRASLEGAQLVLQPQPRKARIKR